MFRDSLPTLPPSFSTLLYWVEGARPTQYIRRHVRGWPSRERLFAYRVCRLIEAGKFNEAHRLATEAARGGRQ